VVFGSAAFLARVKHMRVAVDQPWQHRRLAQIDYLSPCRNLNLTLRPDISDFFTREDNDLPRQHLPALAVEQMSRADRFYLRRRRALQRATIRSYARRYPRPAPRARIRLHLALHRRRAQQHSK